jgi:hypothetical protein
VPFRIANIPRKRLKINELAHTRAEVARPANATAPALFHANVAAPPARALQPFPVHDNPCVSCRLQLSPVISALFSALRTMSHNPTFQTRGSQFSESYATGVCGVVGANSKTNHAHAKAQSFPNHIAHHVSPAAGLGRRLANEIVRSPR